MKKYLLLSILIASAIIFNANAQNNSYNMVITMVNGTTITIGPNDIENIAFNDGEVTVSGKKIEDFITSLEEINKSKLSNEEFNSFYNKVCEKLDDLEEKIAKINIGEINNDIIQDLQNQINNCALSSNLEALKQTVDANAADIISIEALIAQMKGVDEDVATKKELAEVKAIAEAAATKEDLIQAAAKAADDLAKVVASLETKVETDIATAKSEAAADAAKELAAALGDLGKATVKEYVNTQIGDAVEDLADAKKYTDDELAKAASKAADDLAKAVTTLETKIETDIATAKNEATADAAKKLAAALGDLGKATVKEYVNTQIGDAVEDLADAKKYTDDELAKAASKAADDLAKAVTTLETKVATDIATAKSEAAANAAEKQAAALGDLGKATVKEYVNTQIGDAVDDLKEEIASIYQTK